MVRWSCDESKVVQQQIVRGVSINDITCHLKFQVRNLTLELDFPIGRVSLVLKL